MCVYVCVCVYVQIDLSDDLVVLMMFADGQWERQLSPVEYEDDKGKTQQLKLEEKEFREVRRVHVSGHVHPIADDKAPSQLAHMHDTCNMQCPGSMCESVRSMHV